MNKVIPVLLNAFLFLNISAGITFTALFKIDDKKFVLEAPFKSETTYKFNYKNLKILVIPSYTINNTIVFKTKIFKNTELFTSEVEAPFNDESESSWAKFMYDTIKITFILAHKKNE